MRIKQIILFSTLSLGIIFMFSYSCYGASKAIVPQVFLLLGNNDGNVTTVASAGQIWMDRNLGASHVATSPTDSAAFGDLYQWGRFSDGHEKRTSPTTTTLSTSDVPVNDNFITNSSVPSDWRTPKKDSLWQGVSGINNPCPAGFRLPTATELDTERSSWSSNDSAGAYSSPLKLVAAEVRASSDGSIGAVGNGYYWSSSVLGNLSRFLYFFNAPPAHIYNTNRANGFSVRCIKD